MNKYRLSVPDTIVYLFKFITNTQTNYIIFNENMTTISNIDTQSQPSKPVSTTPPSSTQQQQQPPPTDIKTTNKKLTNDTSDIQIYKQFKYSNYSSLNIDLLLNPKEMNEWISKNNINNYIDINNNFVNDNIKFLTSLLFKKNNILTILNRDYVIDSYSFESSNIISNTISDLYFINNINISNQYTLSNNLITEINQTKNKINEISSIKTDELLDERVKLYTQHSENLYILSQIYFKNILDNNSKLNTIDIPKIGSLPNVLFPNDTFKSMYVINKYYNTYKSYSKLFANNCNIYKKNKNKKFPQINTFTNVINQLSDKSNTSSFINPYTDTINELYSNTTKNYVIVLIYYLLDYILILNLVNNFVDKGGIELKKIELEKLMDHGLMRFENMTINNNIINLENNRTEIEIQFIKSTYWDYNIFQEDPIDQTETNTKILEQIRPYLDKLSINTPDSLYNRVYKYDILYINCINNSILNEELLVAFIKRRIDDTLNGMITTHEINQSKKDEILQDLNTHMKSKNKDLYSDIKSFADSNYISTKINYAISLSKYINYFEQNINTIIENDNKYIYSTSMENFDNTDIYNFSSVITKIKESLEIMKSIDITDNLDIDLLYQENITGIDINVKNQILNILKCKINRIQVSDSLTNVSNIKRVIDRQSTTSISNLMYLIWFFYNKSNPIIKDNNTPPETTQTPVLKCKIPNLFIPSNLINNNTNNNTNTNTNTTLSFDEMSADDTQKPNIINLVNTLVIEQSTPADVFYEVKTNSPLNNDSTYTLHVTDGNIKYSYNNIKIDNHLKIDPLDNNNILSKYTILNSLMINGSSVPISKSKPENKKYVNLIIKGNLTKEGKKKECDNNYIKIKDGVNNVTNNTFTTIMNYISSFRSKKNNNPGQAPAQIGGGHMKTQKNNSEKIRMFVNANLSKISKFNLYINKYSSENSRNDSKLYKLSSITSKIFIPFQVFINKMKRDSYYPQSIYIKFIDFYNNHILHPCNIINNIYDVCKMIITDIHFIDKLCNKLHHIYKSDFFNELKKVTRSFYTKKNNNNKIDLLI